MNCEQVQRELPLMESGECRGERAARLAAHLAGCAACREYRSDLSVLTSAAGARREGPAPAVLARIRDEARRRARLRVLWLRRPEVSWLAAAAALALVAGIWLRRPAERQEPDRVAAMTALVAMVAEDDGEEATEMAAPADREAALRQLARRLLEMEGLDAETLMEWEDEAPRSTDSQSRSTPGPRAAVCV